MDDRATGALIFGVNPLSVAANRSARAMHEICAVAPVVPVLTIHDVRAAVALAKTLVTGGLSVLEVTLRTPQALEAIKEMSSVKGALVGAGTVLGPNDVEAAKSAGAKFAVSPGSTQELLQACKAADLPILPGAATASEAMELAAQGHDLLKFFPAMPAGGVPALKALSAPLPEISFCPTGGIDLSNATDFLNLPNVVCVGGSWVASDVLIKEQAWDQIEARAREAAALGEKR